MFIRWKQRPLRRRKSWSLPDEQILSAAVVESVRVDGKPRQRVIRYLSSIHESDITMPRVLSLDRFWQQVDVGLADLDLADEQRQAITARISATVPRPDAPAVEQARAEFEAWKGGVQSMLRHIASRRRTRSA